MFFKFVVAVSAFIAVGNSLPTMVKRSPNMPSPPSMPPGMPAPPMSPPGMIIAAHEMMRFKRQAETTPPSRFVRQAETAPPSRFVRQAPETTQPSRFVRQAETTPPSKRIARNALFDSPDMPKTVAQEAFYSKITTINGDK